MELEAIKKRAHSLSQRLAFIESEVEALLNYKKVINQMTCKVYCEEIGGGFIMSLDKITTEFIYEKFFSNGIDKITITKI